jgi:hypothetical protein
MEEKTPIRMRGYYRALKRKASWAMKIAKYPVGSFAWMMAYYLRDGQLKDAIRNMHSVFNLIPKEHDTWKGAYVPIPMNFKR